MDDFRIYYTTYTTPANFSQNLGMDTNRASFLYGRFLQKVHLGCCMENKTFKLAHGRMTNQKKLTWGAFLDFKKPVNRITSHPSSISSPLSSLFEFGVAYTLN